MYKHAIFAHSTIQQGASRAIHASAPALKGRWTTQKSDRVKHWKKHVSKKAKSRKRAAERLTAKYDRAQREQAAAEAALTPWQRASKGASEALSLGHAQDVWGGHAAARKDAHALAVQALIAPQKRAASARELLASEDAPGMHAAMRDGREPYTVGNVAHVVRAYGAVGQWPAALAVYNEASKHHVPYTDRLRTALLTAAGYSGQPEALAAAVQRTTAAGPLESAVAWRAAITAAARVGERATALALLQSALQAGVPAHAGLYTPILVAHVHAGDAQAAWALWDFMRTDGNIVPDGAAFTTMIAAAGRMDQPEKAAVLLDDARTMGVAPDHAMFTASIYAAARSFRRSSWAFDRFEEMKAAGFAPDLRTYNSVLLACTHDGEVLKARGFMAELVREGLQPDQVTFNTLLAVYARGMRRVGSKAARKVRGDGPLGEHHAAMDFIGQGEQLLLSESDLSDQDDLGVPLGLVASKLPQDPSKHLDTVARQLVAQYFVEDAGERATRRELEAEDTPPDFEADLPGGSMWEQERLKPEDVLTAEWRAHRAELEAAGVSDGALDDWEWEAVHGRPDTDTDTDDPWVRELIERRISRGSQYALAEDTLRRSMGLAPVNPGWELVGASDDSDAGTVNEVDAAKATGGELALHEIIPGLTPREAAAAAAPLSHERSFRQALRDADASGLREAALGSKPKPLSDSEESDGLWSDSDGSQSDLSALVAKSDTLVQRMQGRGELTESMRAAIERNDSHALRTEALDASAAKYGNLLAGATAERSMLRLMKAERTTQEEIDRITVDGKPISDVLLASDDEDWTPSSLAQLQDDEAWDTNLEQDAARRDAKLHAIVDARLAELGDVPEEDAPVLDGDMYHAGIGNAVAGTLAGSEAPLAVLSPPVELGGNVSDDARADAMAAYIDFVAEAGSDADEQHVLKSLANDIPGLQLVDHATQSTWESTAAGVAAAHTGNSNSGPTSAAAGTVRVSTTHGPPASSGVHSDDEFRAAESQGVSLREATAAVAKLHSQEPGLGSGEFSDWTDDDDDAAGVTSSLAAADSVSSMAAGPDGNAIRVVTRQARDPEASSASIDKGLGEALMLEQLEAVVMERANPAAPAAGSLVQEIVGKDGQKQLALPELSLEQAMAQGMEPWEYHNAAVQRWREEAPLRQLAAAQARLDEAMGRLQAPLDPIEDAVVRATDTAGQAQLRGRYGTQPGVMDVLTGVAALGQDQVGNEHDMYYSSAMPTAHSASSDELAPWAAAGTGEQHTVSLTPHGQRVQDARADLANLAGDSGSGELRLRALQSFSDRILAGAHWLPPDGWELPDDVNEARHELIGQMLAVYYTELPRTGTKVDAVTLNTVVRGLADAGKPGLAYAFIQREFPAKAVKPDERTFRALVDMHVRARRLDLAERLLQLMDQAAVQPSPDVLGHMVHGYAREYRIADAIDLLRDMEARGLACPEKHAALLRARCKEAGVWHPLVPDSPHAWQFSPKARAHRSAKSRRINKDMQAMAFKRKGQRFQ